MATKRRRPVDDDEVPRRSKSGSVKLDFRKTEKGRGGQRYPEGEYKVKIVKAERGTSQNSGNTTLKMTYEIVEPEKFAGKSLRDTLAVTEKAMFRIGWLLEAAGIKWSQKIMTFPLGKLKGKVIGVLLFDDTYNNRVSSKVAEYYDEETVDGIMEGTDVEDEEDEDIDDEEEEDEDEEDEDDDDEDEDDL